MSKLAKLVAYLLIILSHGVALSSGVYFQSHSLRGAINVNSWKVIRDHGIEKQDEDYSCGSAAVATILRSFYGLDVYEKDILDEVVKTGDEWTASFSDLYPS